MDMDRDNPSTSDRMRKLEEGRLLPWRLANHSVWLKLANKLDLPSPVSNNDWKGLAELLGFSTEDILVLDNTKDRSTLALFTNYLPKKDASVNKVAKALKQMNRDDALQILLDAMPDIEVQYERETKSTMEAVETTDTCVTTMAQGGCRCMGTPPLSFSSQHSHRGYSPCHGHHHPPSHCTLASPSCCCHNVHYHGPPAHPPCASHLHSHRASPGCGGGGGESALTNSHYNIAPSVSYQDSFPSYNPPGRGGGDFFSPASPSRQPITQPQFSRAHPSPRRQFSELGPSSLGVGESMVVHQDDHQDLRSILPGDEMEVDGDEPALLHTTIARGQGLLSMSTLNNQALEGLAGDMGDDTPSTSLEELSSSDSGSRLPPNVTRQMSEECNSKQPFYSEAASPKARPTYDKHSDSMIPWKSGADSQRNNGAGTGKKDNPSSLKELENLSHLPPRFMPGNRFTTMVAEQQIEDVATNPRGLRMNIKRERDSTRSCQYSGLSSGAGPKGKELAGADTYPLRIKPQSGGATMGEVRNRQPGALTKTTSLPIDMKMEEFKKAFRHIKVFVTYANDSKQHRRQVLSLCHCLDRNGFSCCVDAASRSDSPDQVKSTQEWCSRKFKEADFVLVCLSERYLQEIREINSGGQAHPVGSSTTTTNNNNNNTDNNNKQRGNETSIHTALIYRLMQEEYQTTKRYTRFVPLYMEGSSCNAGPYWLTRHLSYEWPRQYKDLLWMLTKPEDRIKQRARESPRQGQVVLRDRVNGHRDHHLQSSPTH